VKEALKSQGDSAVSQESGATAAYQSRLVPPEAQEIAKHFPQLEIIELLGQGGMGVVYKARQPSLDRLVALKILPAEAAREPGFPERFTREARALAKLSHPGIVAVYDFGQQGGLYYLLMEFVDGMNLRQLLRQGKLNPAEALKIVPQICEALQNAHDEGIVHRDIKPENILLDKRGRVKIADFGLAKLLGSKADVGLTRTHQIMGTPHYMAPEQIQGTRDVDHRADIYSLGVTFYEMLTGELPLGHFAPPSQKVQIDVRLDEVVLRTLEVEPEKRYQHASDVKMQVEEISGVTKMASVPRPEQNKLVIGALPADTVSQSFRWKMLSLIAILYALSFVLPAYRFYVSWNNGPSDWGEMRGPNQYGWECFITAWEAQYTCWYANPVFWVGCVLFASRRWLWAGILGLLAVIFATSAWKPFSQSFYLMGYWTWVSSLAILVGASFYKWWQQKTSGAARTKINPQG